LYQTLDGVGGFAVPWDPNRVAILAVVVPAISGEMHGLTRKPVFRIFFAAQRFVGWLLNLGRTNGVL
jgi:hypothetical protein